MQALSNGIAASSSSLTSLSDEQKEAFEGFQQLSSTLSQLQQSSVALQSGLETLHSSIKQVNATLPALISGSKDLAIGANELQQGSLQLVSGLNTLADGVNRLYSGASQLATGAESLHEGAKKLTSGSAELADKLIEAADATATLQGDEQTITLMAQPVVMKEIDERKLTIYGSGIAPYFLSLAFFAGALVYSAVFPIRNSIAVPNASGFSLFVSKSLSFALMSLLQTLLTCSIAVYALKLPVQSVPLFFVYTFVVSLAFMFLIQMLVTWFEKPGQFIALLVLILQLVSSAGTFPYELLPNWAQALNPWLPMTYSVIGYRDVISIGAYDDMWVQVGRLFLLFITSLILIFLFHMLKHKTIKNAESKLS